MGHVGQGWQSLQTDGRFLVLALQCEGMAVAPGAQLQSHPSGRHPYAEEC